MEIRMLRKTHRVIQDLNPSISETIKMPNHTGSKHLIHAVTCYLEKELSIKFYPCIMKTQWWIFLSKCLMKTQNHRILELERSLEVRESNPLLSSFDYTMLVQLIWILYYILQHPWQLSIKALLENLLWRRERQFLQLVNSFPCLA